MKRLLIIGFVIAGAFWLLSGNKEEKETEPQTPAVTDEKIEATIDSEKEKTDEVIEKTDKEEAKEEESKKEEVEEAKEESIKDLEPEKETTKPKLLTPETVKTTRAPQPPAPVEPTTPVVVIPSTQTSVKVYLYEWGIDLSSKSIPAGTINFKVTNNGALSHNFEIPGVKNYGKVIPGATKEFQVKLWNGSYEVVSTRRDDLQKNMKESFSIIK